MSKRETIDRIMAHNPSATPEFLAEFTDEDLGAYLRQLESVHGDSPLACASRGPRWGRPRSGAHAGASLGG